MAGLDDLTNSLFGMSSPTATPSSGLGSLGALFGGNAGQQQNTALANKLMAAGGPQFLQSETRVPRMPQGGGQRGPFPFFAPTINPMPIPAQIPNFAALLQMLRQSQPVPFALMPQYQNLAGSQ